MFLLEPFLQLGSAELFVKESKFLIFGNGEDKPPTGFMFEKQLMRGLYFHQSPAKVPLQFKFQTTSSWYPFCFYLFP